MPDTNVYRFHRGVIGALDQILVLFRDVANGVRLIQIRMISVASAGHQQDRVDEGTHSTTKRTVMIRNG